MPVFRKALDRLADLLRHDRKITYRAFIDARTAPYVTPLLDRIVADDEDGETVRIALIPWQRAERPPIALYRGDVSTCRIDGPWQVVDDHWFPLGGLILSPGVTAHLNPFEAQALHKHMEKAIEDAIVAWVRDHDLYALRSVPEEIDRKPADHAAKAMIAAWVAGSARPGPHPAKASTDRTIAAPMRRPAPCAKPAGKGRTMVEPERRKAGQKGCDATHRANNPETHLTHGCMAVFRHFSRQRSDSAFFRRSQNGGFPSLSETADRCRRGGGQ